MKKLFSLAKESHKIECVFPFLKVPKYATLSNEKELSFFAKSLYQKRGPFSISQSLQICFSW